MNNEHTADWKLLKYVDGVKVSAYRPKYALNLSFNFNEFKVYVGCLAALCCAFTVINYIENWELTKNGTFWLGFSIAILNFLKFRPVFGIITPERTLIRACVVLDGTPQQISKAYTETHCELKSYALSKEIMDTIELNAHLSKKIRMQQFLLTLQSMDLSPFWLGLGSLLRTIGVTRLGGSIGQNKEQSILSSGTAGMKHIAFSDNKNNHFVLKQLKKK